MEERELDKEKQHLKEVVREIDKQLEQKEKEIDELSEEMKNLKHHFSEEYHGLDDEETVTGGDELDEQDRIILETKQSVSRLLRQKQSPYFGKMDFKADDEEDENSYYIGTFNLTDGTEIPAICDWRAPISSMYYDFEVGKCEYTAPVGKITGEIFNKRQFKIKNSKIEMCFDSSLTIGDNILQQELANNANQKMKTIVATIQKEQNKIIRDDKFDCMLVQGVAGSGKTSIALHKIAYLLYSQKDMTSKDVLIISPNSIFSEYISTVLPELGEQNVMQTSFLQMAKEELKTLTPPLQSREEMVNELLGGNSERLNQVAYKNCIDFYESLKIYLHDFVQTSFKATDLKFGDLKIPAQVLQDLFDKNYHDKKPAIKIDWIADYIVDQLDVGENGKLIFPRVKKVLLPMLGCSNILDIYADFLSKIGLKFSLTSNGKIAWEDVASILFIKDYLIGVAEQKNIKYLIIDEMQDYSPVHFALFDEIFECKKIILGDIYQCIDKIMTTTDLDNLSTIIGAKEVLYLNKTYRSTYEITEFADSLKNKHSDKVERHGKTPLVFEAQNKEEEIAKITEIIENGNKYETIAIICKDLKEAEDYYTYLGQFEDLQLITEDSVLTRLMIMPASVSKGLEFDMVIIPNSGKNNYNNFVANNLLYVSCTRALHELCLTSIK